MDQDGILRGLNDAQKLAVLSPASALQVLAPPGSGKTRTLTARVAHHLSNDGLSPWNVVVCTFTIKAAREMGERIEGFVGHDISGKLILGTFHSICRRFLVSYGSKIGIDPKFAIADSADSKSAIARIVKQYSLTTNLNVARSRISRFKANRVSVQQYAETLTIPKKSSVEEQEIITVYRAYEDHLKRCGLLDYDDLLLRCADLLHTFPECVAHVEAVLVDEFQDTNQIQYDLMRLFAQHKKVVCVVGDPDQSIYGWRSAKRKNLQRMRDDFPGTQIMALEENYRSSGCILCTAQQVIEQDLKRPRKSLMPTHSIGLPATMRKLKSAGVEAGWLVTEIQRLLALTGGLLSFDDFAILLRSASLSRLIETSLGRHGIPYRFVGGHSFFDRFEVRLLLDYLRVLDHPNHTDALLRIVNVPPRKVGEVSLEVLLAGSAKRKLSLWDIILKVSRGEIRLCQNISASALQGLGSFVSLVLNGRRKLHEHSDKGLVTFLQWLIGKLQLRSYIREKYPDKQDHESRLENIDELAAQCGEAERACYESTTNPTRGVSNPENDPMDTIMLGSLSSQQKLGKVLSYFLANIALCTDGGVRGGAVHRGSVTLSTMHAAKGLEWPVVFIPSAYNGSIPHSRAEDSDEERRLLYVGMTRAQSMLYMSYPVRDSLRKPLDPCPFLSPQEVARHLTERGHNLDYDSLSELSKILGRPTPHPAIIARARAEAGNTEDNIYPQCDGLPDNNSDSEPYADIDTERGTQVAQGIKRGRSNDAAGHCIDVRDSSSLKAGLGFSTAPERSRHSTFPTQFSPVFVRASSLEDEDRPSNITTKTPPTPGRRGSVLYEVDAPGPKRSKRVENGQTSIYNFFTMAQRARPDENQPQFTANSIDGRSTLTTTAFRHGFDTSIQSTSVIREDPCVSFSKIGMAGTADCRSQRKTLGPRRDPKCTWNARANR